MSTPLAAWHTEHVYFGRLLDLLQQQVEVFHTGERPNYEAMFDIIEYLRHYTDRVHHPREDAAFAFLAQRRPGMQLELEHLSQEHRVLAQAGEMLLKYLNEIVEGAVVPRAQVEATAATYVLYYRSHIATEEKEVLRRAAESLTPEEWAAVAQAVPAGHDPLFGASPEERYKELRRRMAL
ncbi:MAG TPA: hemerythrin domain-containing protein [Burkholderiales bacterium]|nr:hemerythrin domain-containing protein [Burkholderiales bacterium]